MPGMDSSGESVAALIQVRGEVRRALGGGEANARAIGAAPSALAQLARGIASGAPPPAGWVVELFPELSALYVAAPAEEVARLLADPDVAAATVPDQGP